MISNDKHQDFLFVCSYLSFFKCCYSWDFNDQVILHWPVENFFMLVLYPFDPTTFIFVRFIAFRWHIVYIFFFPQSCFEEWNQIFIKASTKCFKLTKLILKLINQTVLKRALDPFSQEQFFETTVWLFRLLIIIILSLILGLFNGEYQELCIFLGKKPNHY